jgi:hypothetical protein
MKYIVSSATVTDIIAIYHMGTTDPAFAVSKSIRFYEESELLEWITNSKDNIILVAKNSADMAGFLYCKIMSSHWAMLDNFYVGESHRNGICSSLLFEELKGRLLARGISYLSTLTQKDNVLLSRYVRKWGFIAVKEFVWHELFLKRPTE